MARQPVRRSELVEIDLGEANAVLRQLSQDVGPLRGHKFAVGIRRTGELAVAGAAVCAMPAAGPLQDGLTVELHRIAVATVAPANTMERLLAGIADLAARHGYRRLVTHGAAGAGAEALDATGWCVLPQRLASTIDGRPDADDHGGWRPRLWTQVLRGELR